MRYVQRSIVAILALVLVSCTLMPSLVEGYQSDSWIDTGEYTATGVESQIGDRFECTYEVTEYVDTETGLTHEGGQIAMILIQSENFTFFNYYDHDFSEWYFNLTRDAYHIEYGSGRQYNLTFQSHEHYVFVRVNPHATKNIHLILEWSLHTIPPVDTSGNLFILSLVAGAGIVAIACICIGKERFIK